MVIGQGTSFLDHGDLVGDVVILDDEVALGDVQPLLGHCRRHQQLAFPAPSPSSPVAPSPQQGCRTALPVSLKDILLSRIRLPALVAGRVHAWGRSRPVTHLGGMGGQTSESIGVEVSGVGVVEEEAAQSLREDPRLDEDENARVRSGSDLTLPKGRPRIDSSDGIHVG